MTHFPEVKSLVAYTVGFGVQRTKKQGNKKGPLVGSPPGQSPPK